MSFCPQCGNAINENAKFCSKCGAAISVQAEPVQASWEAPTAPAYTPVAPVVPTVSAEPVVSTKDKVLGFVGMGLSIFGLFMAGLGLLYTLAGMEEEGLAFGFSIAFGMFSFAPCIIGRILCGKSANNGNTSGACSAGSVMGLIGIIVSAVMLFFGFINLLV